MADNTKIWPIFRWANWWLSDDLFTGIRNSFYYSNDMEIRLDAKSIFPKKVPAYSDEDTDIDVWDGGSFKRDIVAIVYSGSSGDEWIVATTRYIYSVKSNWTVTQLGNFSEEICDMEIFNGYLYISTHTHLYYKKDNWLYRNDLFTSTDNTDDDYWRFTTDLQAQWRHPLYWSDNVLCVWDKNQMRSVSREVWNDFTWWFTIQKDYIIRFITELWWFVRVVVSIPYYWSEVLMWDKISTYPDEVIPLEWYTIIQAAIYNWYLYLLSNKWLWLLNWYQYYLLKKVEWDVNSTTKNGMVVFDDKLYFIANNGVYIYWAKNKNYSDVLNLWHHVEDWFKLWAIGANKDTLIISRNGKTVVWWTNIPPKIWFNEWKATTGELQTMAYFGTSLSEIKQSMYLRVGYHIPKEWTNSWDIHIYYRTEADAVNDDIDSWERHPVQPNDEWLFATWDMRSPFATTLKLNCRFQWIQFKFVVTNCVYDDNWTTKTKDTNLYSADLYYNVMLD